MVQAKAERNILVAGRRIRLGRKSLGIKKENIRVGSVRENLLELRFLMTFLEERFRLRSCL